MIPKEIEVWIVSKQVSLWLLDLKSLTSHDEIVGKVISLLRRVAIHQWVDAPSLICYIFSHNPIPTCKYPHAEFSIAHQLGSEKHEMQSRKISKSEYVSQKLHPTRK